MQKIKRERDGFTILGVRTVIQFRNTINESKFIQYGK